MFFRELDSHRCDLPRFMSESQIGMYWYCDNCGAIYSTRKFQGWMKTWQPDFASPKVTTLIPNSDEVTYLVTRERERMRYQHPLIEFAYVLGGTVGVNYHTTLMPWENATKPSDFDEVESQTRPTVDRWTAY